MNIKRYKSIVIGLLIVVLFSYPITTAIASSEPNGYVINEATLYSGPSYNASGYTTLSAGTEICVYGQYHQWYEVGWNGKTGYVLSEYVSIDHKQEYTITIDATPVPIAPVATPVNKPVETTPGDILCFGRSKWNIFHTGIYIGDGKFIHSSSPEGVVVSELDGYGLKLIMARRVG